MGLLRKILGLENKTAKPYIDAGMALIGELRVTLNVPGWKDFVPSYTEEERLAIDRKLSGFQRIANEELGGEAKFHPDIIEPIQRQLISEALADLAGASWKFSDDFPAKWRQCVSTYFTAWVATFDPLVLLDLGNLLVKAGYRTEAKEVFQVLLLFPTYADTYYGTFEGKTELVKDIVDLAKESLRELF
jgi:hypothetical protein